MINSPFHCSNLETLLKKPIQIKASWTCRIAFPCTFMTTKYFMSTMILRARPCNFRPLNFSSKIDQPLNFVSELSNPCSIYQNKSSFCKISKPFDFLTIFRLYVKARN